MAETIGLNSSTDNLGFAHLFWKEWDTRQSFLKEHPSNNDDVVVRIPKSAVSFSQVMDEELAKTLQAQEQEFAVDNYLNELEREEMELALSLSASMQGLKEEFQRFEEFAPLIEQESMEKEDRINEFEQFILFRKQIFQEIEQNEQDEIVEKEELIKFDFPLDSFDDLELLPTTRSQIHYRCKYNKTKHSVKHIRCTRQLLEEAIKTVAKIEITDRLSPFSPSYLKRFNLEEDKEQEALESATKNESKTKKIKNKRINKRSIGSFEEDKEPSQPKEKIPKQKARNYYSSGFEYFRWTFFNKYKQYLLDPFSDAYTVKSIELLPINESVSNRFMNKLQATKEIPSLCYHGTDVKNYKSICQKGLLVPNAQSGIGVVNGSAYGVGIYTSRTASYSVSYARGENSLLVCSVIDDSKENAYRNFQPTNKPVQSKPPVVPSNKCHRYHHKPSLKSNSKSQMKLFSSSTSSWPYISFKNGSSSKVKCSGNVVVLFDSAHVCPLFRLNFSSPSSSDLFGSPVGTEMHALVKKARKLHYEFSKKLFQRNFIESSCSILHTTYRRNPLLWN